MSTTELYASGNTALYTHKNEESQCQNKLSNEIKQIEKKTSLSSIDHM